MKSIERAFSLHSRKKSFKILPDQEAWISFFLKRKNYEFLKFLEVENYGTVSMSELWNALERRVVWDRKRWES